MKRSPAPTVRAPRFVAYQVAPDSPQMEHDFLQVVASLEARSDHPLAKDVVRVAETNGILPVSVEGYQSFAGCGLGGLVQLANEHRPRAVVLGSREFIAECGLQVPDLLEVAARKWEKEEGAFIALGGWDGWVRGVVKFLKG